MKKKSLIIMLLVIALAVTGCGNRHKDISKEDAKEYTALIEEACEEYGYSYSKSVVIPAGASICFNLTNKNDDVEIQVNIVEDEFGNESCDFTITRDIESVDDRILGLDSHLAIIAKISERFSDDLSEEYLKDFLHNEDIWEDTKDHQYSLMYKSQDYLQYSIDCYDTYAKDYKKGDPLEEYFSVYIY